MSAQQILVAAIGGVFGFVLWVALEMACNRLADAVLNKVWPEDNQQ